MGTHIDKSRTQTYKHVVNQLQNATNTIKLRRKKSIKIIWEEGMYQESIVCMEEIAASILLTMFINENNNC